MNHAMNPAKSHPTAPPAFDPNDPHHFAELGEHHGHRITPTRTLLAVLGALLFFTMLTVFVAQAERYAVTEMGWHLPHWVNIAVAMSIATVKALLVIAFFMALKYENPLYTIVFLFCIFAFALFLGLTGMDLDNRGHVYDWKQSAINYGGTGVGVTHPGGNVRVAGRSVSIRAGEGGAFNGSLAENLKNAYIAEQGITEEEYWRRWAEANHVHDHGGHALSDANRSVRRTGTTDALATTVPGADHAPAADHAPGH